ncbi:MAG: hypothetical protein NTZ02_02780 [Candidatus Woesearchaeota archaeon]|nr:hypothetical protein [Candidatus Woesearchaeota archaeon]
MRELMSWETCKNEHIQNVQVDKEKIESIKRMCSIRQKIIPQIKLDDDTASVIATDYYEIIKELLVALMLKNKMKSDNHECLIAFFKHKFPKYEYEVNTIYQLKEVRNRVSYDLTNSRNNPFFRKFSQNKKTALEKRFKVEKLLNPEIFIYTLHICDI